MLLVSALLVVFWIFIAIRPRTVWALQRWQFRRPEYVEPSAAYFFVTRIGAAFLALAAFLVLFVPELRERREADNGPNAPHGKEYGWTVDAARALDEHVRAFAPGTGLRRPEYVERAAREVVLDCIRRSVPHPSEEDIARGCGPDISPTDDYASTGRVNVTPGVLRYKYEPVCLTVPTTEEDESRIDAGFCG